MLTFSLLGNDYPDHQELVAAISHCTKKYNKDNISRTNAYFTFYKMHPEIRWAFLASMVSRNAGWNMCDLEGATMPKILSPSFRKTLFLTYETANYLIFQDVFPQLLLYHYSTKIDMPLFHLNKYFSTSLFMCKEWTAFWKQKNEERLLTALIINEQNVIQAPVIEGKAFRERVFCSKIFLLQDHMHFSVVLFPTISGELYGASVHSFRNLDARIHLGKVLAAILFSPERFPSFYRFASYTEHTGSREDYERYDWCRKQRDTPYLRTIYPVMEMKVEKNDWELDQKVKKVWMKRVKAPVKSNLTSWYKEKQKQLRLFAALYEMIKQ